MTRARWWFSTLLAVAGCQAPGMPIPVRGSIDPLIGDWAGEYVSPETGRSGSIVFSLAAGRDTASGDVLMIPTNPDFPPAVARSDDPQQRAPRVLKISFVRCEGNEVTGWLDPYPDPDTGEKTSTTFDGVIKGDKLEGQFVSYLELSGKRRTGTWVVHRKKTAD